jgi:hypothetical protein
LPDDFDLNDFLGGEQIHQAEEAVNAIAETLASKVWIHGSTRPNKASLELIRQSM